jgi:hypothetical protein
VPVDALVHGDMIFHDGKTQGCPTAEQGCSEKSKFVLLGKFYRFFHVASFGGFNGKQRKQSICS